MPTQIAKEEKRKSTRKDKFIQKIALKRSGKRAC